MKYVAAVLLIVALATSALEPLPRALKCCRSAYAVIHREECINHEVCEPECPANADFCGRRSPVFQMAQLNAEGASLWSTRLFQAQPLADARQFDGMPNQRKFFSPHLRSW